MLWLFKDYRDLYFAQQVLTDQIIQRDRTIADLDKQLTRSPATPGAELDVLMKEYSDAIREVPFADGKIPDNFWLSPGENVRAEVEA